jgi:hypothetical protein
MKIFNENGTQDPSKFKVGDHALHGDVILERISKLPKDFHGLEKLKDGILAHGELTGHLHQLQGKGFDLRTNTDGLKFLHVFEPTPLKHQEHAPIIVPPGEYKIGIQREYDPFAKRARQVVD